MLALKHLVMTLRSVRYLIDRFIASIIIYQ
jgi:hypothetical protein